MLLDLGPNFAGTRKALVGDSVLSLTKSEYEYPYDPPHEDEEAQEGYIGAETLISPEQNEEGESADFEEELIAMKNVNFSL